MIVGNRERDRGDVTPVALQALCVGFEFDLRRIGRGAIASLSNGLVLAAIADGAKVAGLIGNLPHKIEQIARPLADYLDYLALLAPAVARREVCA